MANTDSPVPGWTCDQHMEQYVNCKPLTMKRIHRYIKMVLHRMQKYPDQPPGGWMYQDGTEPNCRVSLHKITQTDNAPVILFG